MPSSTYENVDFPAINFQSTNNESINLNKQKGRSVLYIYPRTTPENGETLPNWDGIPGARGCSIQSRGFALYYKAILSTGVVNVFGLSAQSTGFQLEAKGRLELPFELLSDTELSLARELDLPTFKAGELVLYKRMTLIINNGLIEKSFFPISSPADNAQDVLSYLETNS